MSAFNGVKSSKPSKRIDLSPPPPLDDSIMCYSTTRIFYGIIIKAWSLYIASLAFERLSQVSRALDIIMMRCRNKSLATATKDGTRSSETTVEIWEMIRREVIGLEIIAVETEELERVCPPCRCGHLEEFNVRPRGQGICDFYQYGIRGKVICDEANRLITPSNELLNVSAKFPATACSQLTCVSRRLWQYF
jgi:hypothetical protein